MYRYFYQQMASIKRRFVAQPIDRQSGADIGNSKTSCRTNDVLYDVRGAGSRGEEFLT